MVKYKVPSQLYLGTYATFIPYHQVNGITHGRVKKEIHTASAPREGEAIAAYLNIRSFGSITAVSFKKESEREKKSNLLT